MEGEQSQLQDAGATQLPPAEATQLPIEGAEQTVLGAEIPVEGAVQPTERTYSQEEFRKLQSAADRQVAEERQMRGMLEQQYAQQAQQAALGGARQQDMAWLRQVAEQGGDVDAAKQVVAQRDAVRQQQLMLYQQQQQHMARSQMQDQIARGQVLQVIAGRYGVKPEELVNARTPQEAVQLAQDRKIARLEAGRKPPLRIDSGVITGRGYSEASVRKAYAEGTIDTNQYTSYLKSIGKEP